MRNLLLLASTLTTACVVATPAPPVPDDAALFSTTFVSRGPGETVVRVAADNTFQARLDGRPLPLGGSQTDYDHASTIALRLPPGPHRFEISVVNLQGAGVSWAANPAGVAFTIDERMGGRVARVASSQDALVDGHRAVPVQPNDAWTRDVDAPWVWRRPAG